MPYLTIECDTEEERFEGYGFSEEEQTVRIANPAKENGCADEENRGPLSWLNSVRVTTDPKDDAVHCVVSVGDPRGGFCVTFRRRPDTGALLIHMPHPGEGIAHEQTKELHPGTLVVVGHDGEPIDFSDEESEDEEN